MSAEVLPLSTLDGLSEGVQVMDRDWRYLYLNDVAVRQSGYRRDELIGRSFVEMYPGVDQTRLFATLRESMEERVETRTTNDFTFPDGSTRHFELRVYPVTAGILIFSLDVTEEVAREIIIAELDDLVARRTADLSAANQELMQLNYLVSHDLQAPLRTIQQFVGLLRRHLGDSVDAKGEEYLGWLERSGRRLQSLVSGIMRHGRIGEGAESAHVDTTQLAREVWSDLRADVERTGALLDLGELPALHGYPDELRLLFQNIIANALKFARPGEPPRIGVSGHARDDGACEYTFRDNGIGIPEEHREHVFGLFKRLHGDSEYPGAGVGLAHCQKIAALHRGTIELDATPEGGCSVQVVLRPIDREPG